MVSFANSDTGPPYRTQSLVKPFLMTPLVKGSVATVDTPSFARCLQSAHTPDLKPDTIDRLLSACSAAEIDREGRWSRKSSMAAKAPGSIPSTTNLRARPEQASLDTIKQRKRLPPALTLSFDLKNDVAGLVIVGLPAMAERTADFVGRRLQADCMRCLY